MATLKVYSYVIKKDIQYFSELKELFTDCISIEITDRNGLEAFYNYDFEDGLLIPVKDQKAAQYSLLQEVPTDLEIEAKSSKILPFPIAHTTSSMDWQRTILDLTEKGIVKTSERRSFFKENTIKFWFSDEDEINAVDVDYLGTKLSYTDGNLINRVLSEWKKLNL